MNRSNYNKKFLFFQFKTSFLIIACALLIASLVLLNAGCSPSDSSNTNIVNETENNDNAKGEEDTGEEQENELEDLSDENANDEQPEEEAADLNEELTIKVYYTDPQGEYLIGEARIVSSANKYVDALNELIKLPIDDSLVGLVPDTTLINSITVEDGLAKVDLSENFVEDRFPSDTVDVLLVYSIVNTLTEFSDVHSIIFYIDGEKLDIIGMLDISEPMFRREDLIKKS